MIIFNNIDGILNEVAERPFKIEKQIQNLFEGNLNAIMGLELVASEFTIKNKRIDTLAYDKQSSSFIIIEYKRDKNISVIDQGFTYLSLMLENKADFIIEYNESLKQNLKREDIDWSQTRVAFVSTSFTDNQIQATNFKDIAIELWEVKQYETGLILIIPVKKTSSAGIKPIAQRNPALKSGLIELKTYSEEEHFKNISEETVALYEKFKSGIQNLTDDVELRPLRVRISFRKGKKIITDISIFKNHLKIWINAKKGMLDDSKGITTDVSAIGHWGNGDYQLEVTNDNNLEYIMSLIKQVL